MTREGTEGKRDTDDKRKRDYKNMENAYETDKYAYKIRIKCISTYIKHIIPASTPNINFEFTTVRTTGKPGWEAMCIGIGIGIGIGS